MLPVSLLRIQVPYIDSLNMGREETNNRRKIKDSGRDGWRSKGTLIEEVEVRGAEGEGGREGGNSKRTDV